MRLLRAILRLMRSRLAFKVVGLPVALVALTIGYFAYMSYRMERAGIEQRFGTALTRIAATAALSIRGTEHLRIQKPGDEKSPEFFAIASYLRRVRDANGLRDEQIYTFQVPQQPLQPGTMPLLQFGVMLQQKTFVGDPYQLPSRNIEALRRALFDKQAAHTELYRDEHGVFISAYAPILTGSGELAGVLEVDTSLTEFMSALTGRVQSLVLLSLSAVLLGVLLGGLLAYGIRSALRSIRLAAHAIENQDYTYRIHSRRDDELGTVAAQIDHMAASLGERFQMLKYLPKHTLELIQQRAASGGTDTVEHLEGSVMFTDIRGFTALSNEIAPEELVRVLNTYLRRQVEIIEEHGGVVDKFVGDAVLAMFSGPQHGRRSILAALNIRQAVIEMNNAGMFAFPVHIGIGITSGGLVLGDIGSEHRKERTPLGPVVNMASRLCSAAGAGEIIVSESTRGSAGRGFRLGAGEHLQLKGFPTEQLVYQVLDLLPGASGTHDALPPLRS